MLRWLHRQFIPHEANDYKPHFLRPYNAVKVLTVIIAFEIILLSQVYVFPQFRDFIAAILPGVLVELTNNSRQDSNAGNLAVNPLLVISAQMKAEHMARNGYFAHDSPTGESPWHWFNKSGYKFLYAGENIAVHFVDSEDVHRAWMASDSHRANILNPNFTEIGIGIAQGVHRGRSAIFIVQHFGQPLKIPLKPNQLLAIGGRSEETDFVKKILSAPNNLIAFVYYLTLFAVAIALALKIFIKIRIQYPSLIFTGLALLFVISGLVAANYYLLAMPGRI